MNSKYFVIYSVFFITVQVIKLSEAFPLNNDQQPAVIGVSTEQEVRPVDEGRVAAETQNVRNARQYGYGGSNAFASANAGSFGGGFPGGFSGASASASAQAGGFGYGIGK